MIHVLPSPFRDPFEFMSISSWLNGTFSPIVTTDNQVSLSLATNALHYAGSLFEGQKATQKNDEMYVFRMLDHYKRFAQGCARLALPAPSYEMYVTGVMNVMRHAQKANLKVTDWYIRPLIFANTDSCGAYSSGEFMFVVMIMPHTFSPGKLTKIRVERELKRTCAGGIGDVKAAANYVAGRLADMKSLSEGYMTLWTDALAEYIHEMTTASVMFLLADGRLISPIPDGQILDSITRKTILENASAWGYKPESRPVSIAELRNWLMTNYVVEAMQVGTAITALPIVEIALDNKVYPISPFTYEGSAVEKIYTGMHEIYSTSNKYTMIV
jgi:branched-chain amino acid aminotransferase